MLHVVVRIMYGAAFRSISVKHPQFKWCELALSQLLDYSIDQTRGVNYKSTAFRFGQHD